VNERGRQAAEITVAGSQDVCDEVSSHTDSRLAMSKLKRNEAENWYR